MMFVLLHLLNAYYVPDSVTGRDIKYRHDYDTVSDLHGGHTPARKVRSHLYYSVVGAVTVANATEVHRNNMK